MKRICGALVLLATVLSAVAAEETGSKTLPATGKPSRQSSLASFVLKDEPEFSWRLLGNSKQNNTQIYHLALTSQRWQDILWQHDLVIYEPAKLLHESHVLLLIGGGANGKAIRNGDHQRGTLLARLTGARVAMIHQVPNQPLMGGRVEDDLITETWLRYLETGDESWPLLFPMVKSATSAMDAIQAFAESQQWVPVQGFVTTGASKRGWTSWLTPAVEPRVVATAPMVIDMLNFPEQIRHQMKNWGQASDQIRDYTRKGLVPKDGIPKTGREAQLWQMMDPYTYREKLTLPKLLVVGANDAYWSTDAMSLYWDDLEGEKWIYRAANAGHALEGKLDRVAATIAVFFRHVVSDRSLPSLQWQLQDHEHSLEMNVTLSESPKTVQLWIARSTTRDFRQSIWQATPMTKVEDRWTLAVEKKPNEHIAVYADCDFIDDGLPYTLSTLAYCK